MYYECYNETSLSYKKIQFFCKVVPFRSTHSIFQHFLFIQIYKLFREYHLLPPITRGTKLSLLTISLSVASDGRHSSKCPMGEVIPPESHSKKMRDRVFAKVLLERWTMDSIPEITKIYSNKHDQSHMISESFRGL